MNPSDFKHVDYHWNDADAPTDPVERLVYRSNCLGRDQRITNTGGGNTSAKLTETDPLTGEAVDVLWVKGSGGDLRTSKRANFASLYMHGLDNIKDVYNARDDKGPKSQAEDDMVAMYPHVTFDLNPRASSIDTPLHGFLPAKHVDHMHPIPVIAIAAAKDQVELTQKIWGGDLAYVDWQRPGFDLGLKMQQIAEQHPEAVGILMGQHGVINWHDDDKACYELTLELIEKAALFLAEHDKGDATFGGQRYATLGDDERDGVLTSILPWLRGQVSQQKRFIGTVEHRDDVMQFVNSNDAARLAEIGTSCPDHFLRTKIKPLYVDWDPTTGVDVLKHKLSERLVAYRNDYAAYYESCKRPDSPAMRDPNPTVILIPGVGMIAWGKNK
ncbi:MAG: class II aldolase/adducin family protein, partial [Planctomycetota bacterium]